MSWECRIAACLHLDPVRVRRMPLALALLRMNWAAQADGMETWWRRGAEERKDAATVHRQLHELVAEAGVFAEVWEALPQEGGNE